MDEDGHRAPLVVQADQGRRYDMGRMHAIFRADAETAGRYSISEWWLEPHTRGPGAHQHSDDHIYYVLEGALSVGLDGDWSVVEKGGCVVIPGGTPHDFQNRSDARAGFLSINDSSGFEERMPGIAAHLGAEDLRI